MTPWNPLDIDQFWGLSDDLMAGVAQWQADPQPEGAFNVLLCLGQFRLFQIPQTPVTVHPFAVENVFVDLFYVAWREVRRMIDLIANETDNDEGLLQSMGGGIEAQALALDILQSRMLFEGLRLALQELSHELKASQPFEVRESFRQRYEVFEQAIEELDDSIDAHPEELALASDSAWPYNVRMTLPQNAWQPRPWWLTEHASHILRDHRDLVRQLSDAGIAGTVRAELVSSGIDWVQPARKNIIAEEDEAAEFNLAADISASAAQIRIADFQGQESSLKITSTISIPSGYKGESLHRLPDTLVCKGLLHVICSFDADNQQVWRLRWGPLFRDVALAKLSTSFDVALHEWQGNYEVTASQLQKMVRHQGWPSQFWRRFS